MRYKGWFGWSCSFFFLYGFPNVGKFGGVRLGYIPLSVIKVNESFVAVGCFGADVKVVEGDGISVFYRCSVRVFRVEWHVIFIGWVICDS